MEAGERQARAAQFVECLSVQNRSTDLEESVSQDISLRLAHDALRRATDEYQRLVSAMTAEELEEVTNRLRR
jgi:hypothetical protein